MIRPVPSRAALALTYMIGIVWLSSLPGHELARLGLGMILFDLAHLPLYAGLALVTLWSFVGPPTVRVPVVAAMVIFFAASDEWHQQFVPGRVFSWADLGTDAVGIGVGLALGEGWSALAVARRGDPRS